VEYESERRVPRYFFVVDIELINDDSGVEIVARTTQLSRHGCGVAATTPFQNGTKVRIKLTYGRVQVSAHARVIYSNPVLGTGLAFSNIDAKDERILDSWIAEFQWRNGPDFNPQNSHHIHHQRG
jgi:hypothetical protein